MDRWYCWREETVDRGVDRMAISKRMKVRKVYRSVKRGLTGFEKTIDGKRYTLYKTQIYGRKDDAEHIAKHLRQQGFLVRIIHYPKSTTEDLIIDTPKGYAVYYRKK